MKKQTASAARSVSGDNANHRLFILKDKEVEALYDLPHLTEREKADYFTLAEEENAWLVLSRTAVCNIFFILQLGSPPATLKPSGNSLDCSWSWLKRILVIWPVVIFLNLVFSPGKYPFPSRPVCKDKP